MLTVIVLNNCLILISGESEGIPTKPRLINKEIGKTLRKLNGHLGVINIIFDVHVIVELEAIDAKGDPEEREMSSLNHCDEFLILIRFVIVEGGNRNENFAESAFL